MNTREGYGPAVPLEPRVTRPAFRGLPIRAAHEGGGLLPWSWAEERLERSHSFWLSTTRPDGSPHAMPVWGVWLGDALLFDTHPLSQKVRNLAHEPRAVAHVESADDVVILEGVVDVEEEIDEALLERFADIYEERYDFGRPDGAFALNPRIAYAWRNADFRGSATRFAFADQ
jgi:PPOX class probable F420-dependent enzyme